LAELVTTWSGRYVPSCRPRSARRSTYSGDWIAHFGPRGQPRSRMGWSCRIPSD
jgi:hypothetical protein